MNLADVLSLAALFFVAGLYLLHSVALIYAKYKLHRGVRKVSNAPGVSIIKPLVGRDESLAENLRSFFLLDYPKFELLFCVHDACDPAVDVVRSLQKQFPHVQSTLFIGGEEVGLNPKINNMMPGWRASRFPLVLISDSGILMLPEALTDMVAAMRPDVALVTQTPFCADRPGFGACLEQVYFGTSHARIYLAGNCLRFVCSTGMSSLLRKSALEECGGIEAFSQFLAEDYFFGLQLVRRGWKCGLSSLPALQRAGGCTASRFDARVCRWMKLRIAMLPHTILVEPFQDWLMSGFLVTAGASHLLGMRPLLVFLLHTLFWLASDFSLMTTIHNGPLPYSFLQFLVLWFRRECGAASTYIYALFHPDICWRRGVYRLGWGGRIRAL